MVFRRRRTIRKRPRKYSRRRYMRPARSNIRADSTYTEKLTYQAQLYTANNVATFALHWIRSGDYSDLELYPVGTNTSNLQFR